MNREDQIKQVCLATFESYELSSLNIKRDRALEFIETDLREAIEDLNSEETLAARHSFFAVTNTLKEDYREHLVSLKSGASVLCGIRHFGGDVNKPFVKIEPSFELESKEDVLSVYSEVEYLFKKFSPLYINYSARKCLSPELKGNVTLAGEARDIKALPPLKRDLDFQLCPVIDKNYFEWYENGYQEFHRAQVDLSEKVLVNSLEVMEDSREQGLLYSVQSHADNMQGIIAAEKSSFLGREGLYFNEIFLSESLRGKGLAKSVQRRFIEKKSIDDQIIWGTIDAQNIASRKTAEANGRKAIRFENFFTT